jgi:hypothetical protein
MSKQLKKSALQRFFLYLNASYLPSISLTKTYQKSRFEKFFILLQIKVNFVTLFIYFCLQN